MRVVRRNNWKRSNGADVGNIIIMDPDDREESEESSEVPKFRECDASEYIGDFPRRLREGISEPEIYSCAKEPMDTVESRDRSVGVLAIN